MILQHIRSSPWVKFFLKSSICVNLENFAMTQLPGPQTGTKWTKYSLNFKEIYQFQRFLWNWENILFTWSQFADLEAGSSQNFLTSHKLRISGKILPMGTTLRNSKRLHTAGFLNFLLIWTKIELKKFSWLEWPNCRGKLLIEERLEE